MISKKHAKGVFLVIKSIMVIATNWLLNCYDFLHSTTNTLHMLYISYPVFIQLVERQPSTPV